MDAGLQVPAREVARIRPRESPRTDPAHRRALPVAVIDHGGEFGLPGAGVRQRRADGPLPCRLGNRVAGLRGHGSKHRQQTQGCATQERSLHGTSGTCMQGHKPFAPTWSKKLWEALQNRYCYSMQSDGCRDLSGSAGLKAVQQHRRGLLCGSSRVWCYDAGTTADKR